MKGESNKLKRQNKNICDTKNMKYNAVELFPNMKNPKYPWKKTDEHVEKNFNINRFIELKKSGKNLPNYSILTGKKSNISIVDIDHKTQEEKDNHVFYKKYGTDPQVWFEKFGCAVVQSPSGGFHLYFKYDPRIPTIASKSKKGLENINIDTRGDGGLIVSAGSMRGGGSYEVIHGNIDDRSDFPEAMFDFLKDECKLIGGSVNKTITRTKKIKSADGKKEMIIEEIIGCDQSQYVYDIPEDTIRKVIDGLDKSYFNSYQGYLLFTTAMKQMDRQDIWEDYPKLNNPAGGSVDCEEHKIWMLDCWEGITGHKTYYAVNHILLNTKYEGARTCLDYFKYKPLLKNERKEHEIINKEKLGYGYFDEIIEKFKKPFYIIKSDTGTGKTTSFKHFVKNQNKGTNKNVPFISIVSRITLGREQYETFNEHGIDCKFYEDDNYNPNDNYIIQIDSLLKLKWMFDQGWIDKFDMFFDEYNSIIKHLITSDTLSKLGVRIPVIDLLLEMIQEARYVFMTDADISDPAIELFDFIDKDKVVYIKNDYKHNQDTPAEELFSIEQMVPMMKAQKKWICPCDEARSCHLLKEMIGDPEILIIDKNTTRRYDWDLYDRIIFSPKVIYGLDSIMKRPVFCLYQETTIDVGDMFQQINRNRNITKLFYLFQKKKCKNAIFNTLQDAIDDTQDLQKWCEKNDHLHQEIQRVHPIFKQIFNKMKYNRDCYDSNPFAHFKRILPERGFMDKHIVLQSNSKRTKELLKEDKERLINEVHKDLDYVKSKNEYIGLPEDEIENFKEIFCDNQFITRYLYLRRYIFDGFEDFFNADTREWVKGFEDDVERLTNHKADMRKTIFEKEEFNVKKIKTGANKLIFIDRLREKLGVQDRLKINGFKLMDKELADTYYAEYQATFTDRSKKPNNPLHTTIGTQQLINKMYKSMFGISPFQNIDTTEKGKKVRGFQDATLKDFETFYEVYELSKKQYETKKIDEYNQEASGICFLSDSDDD